MADDNVVKLFPGGSAAEEIPVETILENVKEAGLDELMVIGWTEDGAFYVSSNLQYKPDLVMLCELAKNYLIGAYQE